MLPEDVAGVGIERPYHFVDRTRHEDQIAGLLDLRTKNVAVRRGKTAIPSPEFDQLLERSAAGSSVSDDSREAESDDDDDRTGLKRKGPSRRLSKQKRAALARFKKL